MKDLIKGGILIKIIFRHITTIILLGLLLPSSSTCIAQTPEIDSINHYVHLQLERAKTVKNENLRYAISITDSILQHQELLQSDSMHNYVKYVHSLYLLLLNENLKSKEMILEILPYYQEKSLRRWTILNVRLGSLNIRLGQYDEAQRYLKIALPYTQELDLKISYGMIYLYLSDMFQLKADYGNAYIMADSALKIFSNTGRAEWISSAKTSLAYICIMAKNFDDAVSFLEQVYEEEDLIQNKSFMVRPLIYVGILNFELGKIPLARLHLEDGLSKINSLGNFPDRTLIYQYIGKIYVMEKEYKKAENYINKAIEFAYKSRSKRHLFNSKLILIDLELIIRPNKNNLEEAKEIYNWSLDNEDYVLLKDASDYLAEYHVARGDYKTALIYKEVYANASEKKSERDRINELIVLKEKGKFEKEARDRELRENKLALELKANQKIRNYMLFGICILLIMTGLLWYYYDEKRLAYRSSHIANQELTQTQDRLALKNDELTKYIESNIQLEQFAHIASHDLRAPLITINSFSKLLQEKAADKLDENEKTFLYYIRTNGDQMQELVNDLLEYSKINSQKINTTLVNVQKLVETVIIMLKSQDNTKGLSLEITSNLPQVIADEIKLKRVFQNLIGNAIKFADNNKSPKIEVFHKEEKEKWVFYVKDNGIGIKDQSVDIFQPYIQLNRKSEYKGTGLGLSFCQKIIQQHGGKIDYSSIFGEGSTFYFYIDKQIR